MADHHRRSDEQIAQQEEALTDDPSFLEEIVRSALQRILEAEMTAHVGAAPHERTESRTGQRNGYKPRTLKTRVGTLNLLVPQGTGRAPSRPGSSPATKGTRRPWSSP